MGSLGKGYYVSEGEVVLGEQDLYIVFFLLVSILPLDILTLNSSYPFIYLP